ncbi:terpene synthase family protein [Streptomyces sp. NPDC003691]
MTPTLAATGGPRPLHPAYVPCAEHPACPADIPHTPPAAHSCRSPHHTPCGHPADHAATAAHPDPGTDPTRVADPATGALLDLWPGPDHPLLALQPHVSPWLDHLEASVMGWADAYDLLDSPAARDRLARSHLGALIARSYPAMGLHRADAVAGWFTWAFVIDDCHDRQPEGQIDYDSSAFRMLRLLTPDATLPSTAASRLDAILARVWHDLARDRSAAWRMRFTLHMTHFLAAFKYESLNRRHHHTPGLLGYTQLRRASGGITPSLDLLEVASDREIPPLLHETDQFQTMFKCASDVVVWVNDIVSLRKELVAGETTNGVLVLARERGRGLQDAIDAVYGRVGGWVTEFRQAREELRTLSGQWLGLTRGERHAVESYADGMEAWMRGNLDWSFSSDRYRRADGVRLTSDTDLVRGAGPGQSHAPGRPEAETAPAHARPYAAAADDGRQRPGHTYGYGPLQGAPYGHPVRPWYEPARRDHVEAS